MRFFIYLFGLCLKCVTLFRQLFGFFFLLPLLSLELLSCEGWVIEQQVAASMGEAMACLVRVPVEMVKQQMQAGQHTSMTTAFQANVSGPKGVRALYSGYGITMCREVPFAVIQFPIYEYLKESLPEAASNPVAKALCGSVAGGIAAAATTPLDVAKTRIMLGQTKTKNVFMAPMEIAQLPRKYHDEQEALQLCARKAALQYKLPIQLVDAEFQFDRQKLTFIFKAKG